MDIARKILQNYGWQEGDGLGRNRGGITKPIKPSLKFDKLGLGLDRAESDFNNRWWERVFKEAATNLDITQEGEQVKMATKDNDGVEITTKLYSTKKLKKLKECRQEGDKNYHNFLQATTLTNLGDKPEKVSKAVPNDIEVSKFEVLTDEELLKACGGRTAHKAARHGLKLSGKLSRIEQQEAELLAKMMAKTKSFHEDERNKVDTKNLKYNSIVEKECIQQNRKNKGKKESFGACEVLKFASDKLNKRMHTNSKIGSVEVTANNLNIHIKKGKKRKRQI